MKYDFYDDISMLRNYVPNYPNRNLNDNYMMYDNMPTNNVNNNASSISSNNLNLYSPYEGYTKGNAFKDEYIPYKNYQPVKIQINSEKEEMLVNIGEYSFMAHDLNLYLDNHPNDQNALNAFLEYQGKARELINKYEKKYGPLTISSENIGTVPFNWVTNNWPWGN